MQRLRDNLAGRTSDTTFHRAYFAVHLFGWVSAAVVFGVYTALTYWALRHHAEEQPSTGAPSWGWERIGEA